MSRQLKCCSTKILPSSDLIVLSRKIARQLPREKPSNTDPKRTSASLELSGYVLSTCDPALTVARSEFQNFLGRQNFRQDAALAGLVRQAIMWPPTHGDWLQCFVSCDRTMVASNDRGGEQVSANLLDPFVVPWIR